jgi:hypothetical protein
MTFLLPELIWPEHHEHRGEAQRAHRRWRYLDRFARPSRTT